MKSKRNSSITRLLLVVMLVSVSVKGMSQNWRFGAHIDPLITWMTSNTSYYNNEGIRVGLNLGGDVQYFFGENFAISSGLAYITAGGKLSCNQGRPMVFNNAQPMVPAGAEVIYHLHYLNLPVGVRLCTNQMGDVTLFTDLGIDLRVLLRSSVDIPDLSIENEISKNEVYGMNMGWHINAGIEYSLTGSTSLVAGLGFDEDFFDVTKDLTAVDQPADRSGLKMLRIRLGLAF